MTKQNCCQPLEAFLDSEFFKSLGDDTRLNIFSALATEPSRQTVSDIAQCCPQSLSVVSRHLKILKDAGVLVSEKRGKEVMYRINTKAVTDKLRHFADALENCCPDDVPITLK